MDEYQQKALASVAIKEKNLAALAHRCLGLTGEAGELANVVKKVVRDKNGLATQDDIAKIKEKLGDTLYYVAVLSEYFSLTLSDVANANIEKSQAFREAREKERE